MSLPVAECLENSLTFGKVPYFLVGDKAFPLQSWLLRPYPGQRIPEEQCIFNYKLSRACRVIENASNVLASHWWVFMQTTQSTVEKTDRIAKATIGLHNFLQQANSAGYYPTVFVDSFNKTGTMKEGEWRYLVGDNNGATLLQDIPPVWGSRPTTSALGVKIIMKSCVNSMEDSVP